LKYTVVWVRSAEDELAAIWLGAPDRGLVAAAALDIDARLAVNPGEEGESRDANVRIMIARPLAVSFTIVDADRLVRVLNAWLVSSS
jgi:hypothetical protein